MPPKLRQWAQALRRDVVALYVAARDRRTPLMPKLVAAITAAYALSPIDLIPDFIPIFGLLDDLLIVPGGIWLARSLIPDALMEEFRIIAERMAMRPTSRSGMIAVVTLWLLAITAAAFFFAQ